MNGPRPPPGQKRWRLLFFAALNALNSLKINPSQ